MEIKDYIRPTTLVRSIMRKFGIPTYMMYTNSYDKCRTVKCYRVGDLDSIEGVEALYKEIKKALTKAGVKGFSLRLPEGHYSFRPGSFIIRIPRTEQP